VHNHYPTNTKSNPNLYTNPTTKRHAVVSIQLNNNRPNNNNNTKFI